MQLPLLKSYIKSKAREMDLITELIEHQSASGTQGSPKGLVIIRFISKDFEGVPMKNRNQYIEKELEKRCSLMLKYYNVLHESFTPQELIN